MVLIRCWVLKSGDPGVGKTAIAEGLAQRLVEGILKVGTGAFNPLKPGLGS
jgi:DNA helicase TIP49 (TBP-interacting protein)